MTDTLVIGYEHTVISVNDTRSGLCWRTLIIFYACLLLWRSDDDVISSFEPLLLRVLSVHLPQQQQTLFVWVKLANASSRLNMVLLHHLTGTQQSSPSWRRVTTSSRCLQMRRVPVKQDYLQQIVGR